jgi:2-methylcitrate dehydratase PrpD
LNCRRAKVFVWTSLWQLRAENRLTADRIDRIDLRVHPLVLELTGKKAPRTGLESKFSVYHAVAAAMVYGRVGEPEFSDRAVRDPAVIALRERVSATVDRAIGADQVRIAIVLKDGRRLDKFIEHAIGSARNPITDAQLEAKFKSLAEGVLPAGRAMRLIDFCWNMEKAADAAQLARLAAARTPFRRCALAFTLSCLDRSLWPAAPPPQECELGEENKRGRL